MIETRGLTKLYADHAAVEDVDLLIEEGELVVLLGPSGSGKTTLLRMLNRMIEPTRGSVHIDGVDAAAMRPEQLRRMMGYVIQSIGLFPHMTVRKNAGTVPRLLGWDRARIARRVDEMLELVGLDPSVYGEKYPHQLSGGEAQRAGVARALAHDPPILLMDEPFGAVDPITRERLQEEMKRIQAQLRKTVVFVTHDIDEAVGLADRIVLLRSGRVQQEGRPEELWLAPANEFVRTFFGENLGLRIMSRRCVSAVELEPLDGEDPPAGVPTVRLDATLKEALAELVGSRAEHVVVVDEGRPIGRFGFDALVRALGDGVAHEDSGDGQCGPRRR